MTSDKPPEPHTMYLISFREGKRWMCYEHGPACFMSKMANKNKLYKELHHLCREMTDVSSSMDPKEKRRLPPEWRNLLVQILNKIARET